jgi:hypothetical protein
LKIGKNKMKEIVWENLTKEETLLILNRFVERFYINTEEELKKEFSNVWRYRKDWSLGLVNYTPKVFDTTGV